MIEMLYHRALLSVLANLVLRWKLQFISLLICLLRAQSGFSAGNAFQKNAPGLMPYFWTFVAAQDKMHRYRPCAHSTPPHHGIFLDTDTSGISQPMTMMIMLAVLDSVIFPASNYIQFQYKNSHHPKIKIKK